MDGNKVLEAFDVAVPLLVVALAFTLIIGRLPAFFAFFLALFICFAMEAMYSRILLKRREK